MKLTGAFGVWVLFSIVINVIVLWVVLSLVVSGVRAVNHSCDVRWAIDRVTISHLFCPENDTDDATKNGDAVQQ